MVPQCGSSSEVERLRERVRHLERLLSQRGEAWSPDDLAHLQRLAVVGELCSEMSHEVNQPLAAIKWFAEAALHKISQGGDPQVILERVSEILRTIEKQAVMAQTLTSRLHGTARQSGAVRENESIADIVEDVLPLVNVLADRYGVTIDLEGLEDLPRIAVDRLQIGQVLLNLLRNAVEAVAVCPPERRRVLVTGENDERYVTISVRDWGVGINKELMNQLFDRYFTTRRGGTGLGLAISKSIVEDHGGTINVEANSDFGLTFRFSLPR